MKALSSLLSLTALSVFVQAGSAQPQYVTPNSPGAARLNSATLQPQQIPSTTSVLPSVRHRWVVTRSGDGGTGTLRDAINRASAGDTVVFALRCPATIVLTNTLLINQDLSILGPGPAALTITRSTATNAPGFRIFDVEAGNVTLAGLTITQGVATQFSPTGDLLGGAIYNDLAALTISNCVIAGNLAPSSGGGNGFGAGVYSDAGASLTIVDSTISDNQATYAGGGVNVFHAAEFVVQRSTISGNYAGVQGGGLNYQGLAGLLQNSTLSGNATANDGFGSALLDLCFPGEGSVLTLTACTIAFNSGSPYGAVQIAALPSNLGLTNYLLSTLVGSNSSPNFFIDGNPAFISLGHNLDSDGTSGLTNGVNGDLIGSDGANIDPVISPLQDNGGPTYTHALLPGSPALGAGSCSDAAGVPLAVDQRSFPRPGSTGCDIGAFENQAPQVTCTHNHYPFPNFFHPQGDFHEVSAVVNDPDGDALTVVWSLNGVAVQTNALPATHPPQPSLVKLQTSLSNGTNVVTVSVSDDKAPAATCSSTILVHVRPPKIIGVLAKPSFLSPPNGQMVPVKVSVAVIAENGPVTSKIISVSSNQPNQGTQPEWTITGDLTVNLRAQNSPAHSHRVYTITVQCTDALGNSSTGTTQVAVLGSEH